MTLPVRSPSGVPELVGGTPRDSAREILLSVNPKAGARSGRVQVDRLAAELERKAYRVHECKRLDELHQAASEALAQNRLRAVVAAGGDGTISLVANQTPAGTPLAVLPLGTENLLSKYLGLPRDPIEIARVIDQGRTVRMDAGLANDRMFLLMAGVGFDAEVVNRLHAARTGHIRHWSYVKPILDSVRSYEYPPLRVYCELPADGELFESEARWVFVVNLPRYAGGLRMAPLAVGTDGLLDVCTFQRGSLVDGLRYLLGVAFGMHGSWQDFGVVRSARIHIRAEVPVRYQLDGDPAGQLPLEIRVLAGRLTFLVGDAWLRRQPGAADGP